MRASPRPRIGLSGGCRVLICRPRVGEAERCPSKRSTGLCTPAPSVEERTAVAGAKVLPAETPAVPGGARAKRRGQAITPRLTPPASSESHGARRAVCTGSVASPLTLDETTAGTADSAIPRATAAVVTRSVLTGPRSSHGAFHASAATLRTVASEPWTVPLVERSVGPASATAHDESATVHGPSATVHGSLATVHGRSATVHGSPATVHGRSATVHGPSGTVHGSPATVHGTSATVYGRSATVHRTERNRPRITGNRPRRRADRCWEDACCPRDRMGRTRHNGGRPFRPASHGRSHRDRPPRIRRDPARDGAGRCREQSHRTVDGARRRRYRLWRSPPLIS